MSSSLVDLGGRLWAVGSDLLDGVVKIDELLDEISKLQTHERLPKASISREVLNMADERKKPEKETWAAPAATAAIRVMALSIISVRVENLREGRCKKVDGRGQI
jgi:hypothetical protein